MSPGGGQRAVFLDRDGTVIVDRGYLADPDGVAFEPGAVEALRLLAGDGWLLVLVTNQSGVARGYFGLDAVASVNTRLAAMLAAHGVRFDRIEICPHGPDDRCDCRKPAPGMLLRAAARLGIDLARSITIGDKRSDLEAGHGAGTAAILVATGEGEAAREWADAHGVPVVADLAAAARLVTSRER